MSERLGDLTSRERELVDAAALGDVLECSQLSIEQLSATDDPKHTIRAELLRELLLKRCDTPPDPRGVRLSGARITGTLDLTHVQAAVGMQLRGCSVDHPVLLEDAHLPWLALPGSCVAGLDGYGLQVDGGLFLDEGFRATGHGERGAVQLRGAHITGWLILRGADLTNKDGPVLVLNDAEAKTVFLPAEVVCPPGVRGRSTCDAGARRVDLSGFVYTSLESSHWSQWLHLIARHSYGYRPQPYQQLVAVRRAAGHDVDARTILIAQQQDLRERGELGGWLTKTVHRAWGALGGYGYGYRTGRIALALLIVLIAAAGLGVVAGHIPTSPGHYVAMHTAQADDPHGPCSLTEQIGVGIDHGLPLGTTGIRGRCDFDTTSGRGQALTVATWGLQALVWALATLVVAGYSGLIRKGP